MRTIKECCNAVEQQTKGKLEIHGIPGRYWLEVRLTDDFYILQNRTYKTKREAANAAADFWERKGVSPCLTSPK